MLGLAFSTVTVGDRLRIFELSVTCDAVGTHTSTQSMQRPIHGNEANIATSTRRQEIG
jgi:hypothetical protein